MGLLDKLFGGKSQQKPTRSATPVMPTIASPRTARPQTAQSPARPQTAEKPQVKAAEEAIVIEKIEEIASEAAQPEVSAVKAESVVETLDSVVSEVAAAEPAVEEEVLEQVAAEKEPVKEPIAPVSERVITEESVVESVTQVAPTGEWNERLQKRLDTYFARLREVFPDGQITRLNTGHKKLAERGAELRRLTGYEGRLDEFFALGGFVYHRGSGGRPTLPSAQLADVEARLREKFPEGAPTVTQVRSADARLYLDVRAAARRDGVSVGTYLKTLER